MMSTVYRMDNVTANAGLRGFSRMRTTRFAGRMAVEADVATRDLAGQKVSEDRMEKVMRLKAAIEEGRYRVSSHDLAEKMMDSMLGVGGRQVH